MYLQEDNYNKPNSKPYALNVILSLPRFSFLLFFYFSLYISKGLKKPFVFNNNKNALESVI
jgi:hypothetical protein